MQPLPASHPDPSGGALYPEECNLIASLQRIVDQGKQANALGTEVPDMDPRTQLARIFAAFGG